MSTSSSTLALAFCGMTTAIIVICAWVTIPVGVVPVTLQIFGVTLALVVLPKREFLLVIGAYLLMGAVGLPVFSGMRGGLGVLGGVIAASALELLGRRNGRARWHEIVACALFMLVAYACGWVQFMAVAGLEPLPALLTAVVPFIPLDAIKIAVAIGVSIPLRAFLTKRLGAIGSSR